MTAQLLRYLVVGLANTALGFAVILVLDVGLGTNSVVSNALGYVVGAACSYALNRTYTFRSQRLHRKALPEFLALMFVCWVINALVLTAARGMLRWPALPSQALAVSTYTVLFFLGGRCFVFRDH